MCFALLSAAASAQVASNPPYTLEQSVIAGGGAQSTGGQFSIDGTIGQAIAGGVVSSGQFFTASGFWNFPLMPAALGFEADVSARNSGDGSVLSDDVVQVRRFLNGSAVLNPAFNEFQRADSSPFATKGDGSLDTTDVVQTRRYQNGTSPLQSAGGPFERNAGRTSAGEETEKQLTEEKSANGDARRLRVENASAVGGQTVTMEILVDAAGDESEYGFVLHYDAKALSNPVMQAGGAGANVRACNTKTAGQISCSIGGFANNNPASDDGIGEIAAGANQILATVAFTASANVSAGTKPVTLSNVNASSDAAQRLRISLTDGTVTIIGSAAAVTIGGRVLTSDGRGLRDARITLTDTAGVMHSVTTGASGDYRFAEMATGQTVVITVSSKRFQFAQQVVFLTESLNELNFNALP